VTAEPEKINHL